MKMPTRQETERLYDAHAPALFAFLLNLTRDEADTRDLLQEIFVKLARDATLLAGVREERAFLIRLAHNAAIDLMRRRGTRERTKENFAAEIISPFAPTSDPDEKVFREELSAALGELPAEQRAVVHLKLWGGLASAANTATGEALAEEVRKYHLPDFSNWPPPPPLNVPTLCYGATNRLEKDLRPSRIGSKYRLNRRKTGLTFKA
jgi:RNA polymerase sigma-70 factor (ECF subfamily)